MYSYVVKVQWVKKITFLRRAKKTIIREQQTNLAKQNQNDKQSQKTQQQCRPHDEVGTLVLFMSML